jgi:hypothetical protein
MIPHSISVIYIPQPRISLTVMRLLHLSSVCVNGGKIMLCVSLLDYWDNASTGITIYFLLN